MRVLQQLLLILLYLGSASILTGCAVTPPSSENVRPQQSSIQESRTPQDWQPIALPGKRTTQFHKTMHAGRQAWQADAASSASLLHRKLFLAAHDVGTIQFSWKTTYLIESADMAKRESEDAVVRIILSFDGDRSKFSAKNRMLSELSLALTGQELPYASLMYVWCNKRQVGAVITNPRTDRIRKLVVESGPARLGQWLDYERDIRADFIKAFGEEPGALTGIALMTDTDNTQSTATAWYGPVSLQSAQNRTPSR